MMVSVFLFHSGHERARHAGSARRSKLPCLAPSAGGMAGLLPRLTVG
ncbi:hypothetical protein L518_0111 [Bordetella bronchiseptica MBORD675]|nr:hypothetical protein L489_0397 [Bordetella bronchiseptica 00-P-2730]KDC96963.1 hypothetical protein L518_0111 [Bordetella bronchiseptica MBORD675]